MRKLRISSNRFFESVYEADVVLARLQIADCQNEGPVNPVMVANPGDAKCRWTGLIRRSDAVRDNHDFVVGQAVSLDDGAPGEFARGQDSGGTLDRAPNR